MGAGARFLILGSREAALGAMFAEGAMQGLAHQRTARALRGLGSATLAGVALAQWGPDGTWTALSSGASGWREFLPGFASWEALKGARESCSRQ